MLFARTTKQITSKTTITRLNVKCGSNLRIFRSRKKRITSNIIATAINKTREITKELFNDPIIKDITKSREPSIFCVKVNITASVFSNGKVTIKIGIILIQNKIVTRSKISIVATSIFIILGNRKGILFANR